MFRPEQLRRTETPAALFRNGSIFLIARPPLLFKGINILDASCGRANSPPQLRRGGRDIKKDIAEPPYPERTGWCWSINKKSSLSTPLFRLRAIALALRARLRGTKGGFALLLTAHPPLLS